MNADAAEFRMKPWSREAPGLRLTLAKGWTYELAKGPDFDVHYFTSPEKDCTVGIYVGMHPNAHIAEKEAGSAGRSQSRVLGRTVNWSDVRRMGEKEGETFYSETIVDRVFDTGLLDRESPVAWLSLHLMISATTAESAKWSKGLLGTLEILPRGDAGK